jgi:broad specificity phosphatase PhoE
MPTMIILVRHGQTEWNRVERFRGRYDIPLNTTGLKQAQLTARYISKRWSPVAIYCSPLKRAMQTAEVIAEEFHLSALLTDGLIDIDYGLWQGLTPEEVERQWPELLSSWYETPDAVEIPEGETLKQVDDRAMGAIGDLVERHCNQQIVLVSHTVVNRLILLKILGLGNDRFWHLRQEPCAINEIEYSEKGYIVVSMNGTGHLQITDQV